MGILDDAALALEEIAPEDKTRSEVLSARIESYLTAEKWDMAAAVAKSPREGRSRELVCHHGSTEVIRFT